jgi:hypothetical protein
MFYQSKSQIFYFGVDIIVSLVILIFAHSNVAVVKYMYFMDNKSEIAAAITANWETSGAKTISKKDINSLKENPPKFGVLDERAGRKIYAFLDGGVIKKMVIPVYSGKPRAEGRALLAQIESSFTLHDLHRVGMDDK